MARKTILVVDDHPDVARALVLLACSLGYNARAVHEGQRALDDMRSTPPDLLLLDLQMPDMSGWEVLRALRADRSFDQLPVVVCSAGYSLQSRVEAMHMGAQDYIGKDNAFEQLKGVVDRQLAGMHNVEFDQAPTGAP